MRSLTIRNLPDEIAFALEDESRRSGRSLNQTVIDLLGRSLRVRVSRPNGLGRLAGSWSEKERQEFDAVVGHFDQIDSALWRDPAP